MNDRVKGEGSGVKGRAKGKAVFISFLFFLASFTLHPTPYTLHLMAEEQTWHYDANGRCDPFFPLVQEERVVSCETSGGDPTELLQLSGIVWDAGGNSFALLNGTEVKRGERVEGYEITAIRKDAVVLTRDGQSVVLKMTYGESEAHAPTPKRGASRGGESQ